MGNYPDTVALSRLGTKAGASAGYDFGLFMKKFSGEVITAFEEANALKPYVQLRTLTDAKVAQFPVIGGATAKYFSSGDCILDDDKAYLNSIKHSERLIYADKKLLSAVMVDQWDELINHYEVRSRYAEEMGQALAVEWDYITLKNLHIASEAAALFTGAPAGGQVDCNDDSASEIKTAIIEGSVMLDEKFVPKMGRVAVISPTAYYNLLGDKDVIHRDYNGNGNGSLASGFAAEYMGCRLVPSAHVGSATFRTNHDSTANQMHPGVEGNSYVTNATTAKGFLFQTSALGAVRVQDLTFEAEYKMEYQATLMIAKYVMGMGVLRPECVVGFASDVV